MQLLCLSLSYHNTPVELRETLSPGPAIIEETFLRHPIRAGSFTPIAEMAILSTCNRFELYALVAPPDGSAMDERSAIHCALAYLQEGFGVQTGQIEPFFHPYTGVKTVEHLFQVAAGLDSIAIGETQILGQVSRALESALRAGAVRHALSSLFRSAIHAGKRVQNETDIGRHPTSIASIGVQLASARLGGLAGQQTLVIGAGKMGGRVLAALAEHGAGRITLANRTPHHATELAGASGMETVILPFDRLTDGLAEAGLVFATTAAPAPILAKEQIAGVMARRHQIPMTLIDLGVPRNVDTKVRQIPLVTLLDMDDLQDYARQAGLASNLALATAHAIIQEEVAGYEKLLQVIPFIGELHRKVEKIRQQEVEKTLRHIKDADPQVTAQIEILSRALVRKILHEPTMRLRSEPDHETLNDYVDALAKLFDLTESGVSLPAGEGEV